MTNEEAKKWLKKLYMRTDITDEYGDMEDMQPYEEAVNTAIKALEQATILDKIRAEIAAEADNLVAYHGDYLTGVRLGLLSTMQIIDKHRAENEDKE